jgi:hypothetical protein
MSNRNISPDNMNIIINIINKLPMPPNSLSITENSILLFIIDQIFLYRVVDERAEILEGLKTAYGSNLDLIGYIDISERAAGGPATSGPPVPPVPPAPPAAPAPPAPPAPGPATSGPASAPPAPPAPPASAPTAPPAPPASAPPAPPAPALVSVPLQVPPAIIIYPQINDAIDLVKGGFIKDKKDNIYQIIGFYNENLKNQVNRMKNTYVILYVNKKYKHIKINDILYNYYKIDNLLYYPDYYFSKKKRRKIKIKNLIYIINGIRIQEQIFFRNQT